MHNSQIRHRKRLGKWLTAAEVEGGLNRIDTSTVIGVRDKALLTLLIYSGLRRQEVCDLQVNQIQQREGRWVIVDVVGKRNKIRSIPIKAIAKAVVDRWIERGKPRTVLFTGIKKGGTITDRGLTSQAVYLIVEKHFPGYTPHDIRRTFAQLAYRAGAPLKQIQESLGHDSIQTTELYLGVGLDLHDPPSDYIQLRLEV